MLNTHTVIGALLTLSIFVQLFLGYWHHVQFSLGRRNTKATRLHVWNGRFMLAAGMSNTGLFVTRAFDRCLPQIRTLMTDQIWC